MHGSSLHLLPQHPLESQLVSRWVACTSLVTYDHSLLESKPSSLGYVHQALEWKGQYSYILSSCSLFTLCIIQDVHYPLCTLYRMFTIHSVPYTGCSLFTLCIIQDVRYPLCTLYRMFAIHSVHYTGCSLSTLYNIKDIRYPLCTLYRMFAIHSVQYKGYSLSTLYTIQDVRYPLCTI